jgi:transcription termination factor Rho
MGKRKKGGVSRGRGRGGYGGGPNRPQNRGPRVAQNNSNNAQPDVAENNGEPWPVEPGGGVLEMHPNGYGFLRDPTNNYMREMTDPFVPGSMIEKYGLREGVHIKGMVQGPRRNQGPRLREILDVDGMPPEEYKNVKGFDELTPINPEYWLKLEVGQEPLTTRVMDLLTPLGKGQRALIVAPPRTGKTILLQHISLGISTNYPNVKLIVLLIDERPEEVTDMRRAVNGEVVASSLDREIESHVRLSQLVVERC